VSHQIIIGDARNLPLVDKSVHCCVTSPPYWSLRDYGVEDQIGQESTPEEYIANIVRVCSEVYRVLRDDGTFWLNLGDSYANDTKWGGDGGNASSKNYTSGLGGCVGQKVKRSTGLPPKSLMGMPWRVAFALQDYGWTLRQDIVWQKPNGMTESVRDRCTKAHEYVFLLAKRQRYFYDAEAVKVRAAKGASGSLFTTGKTAQYQEGRSSYKERVDSEFRNLRSVWKISTHSFRGAHFATFPPKLASRCILAGTSAKGCCPECGSPWVRVVERTRVPTRTGKNTKIAGLDSDVVGNRDPLRHVSVTKSLGWKPSCKCGREDAQPCVVLDPFSRAGSAGVAAVAAGRRYIGIEINPEYAAMADRRIGRPHAPAVGATGSNRPLPLFD
jgi:DNA modification methylase